MQSKRLTPNVASSLGAVAVLIALVFLFQTLMADGATLSAQDFGRLDFGWVILSGAGYLLSVLATSLSWPMILKSLKNPLPLRLALGIGLTAQIGKYLPGNVGQHFGRAALAARHSVSYVNSGTSTLIELAAAPIAGGVFVLLCVALQPGLASNLAHYAEGLGTPGAGLIVFVGVAGAAAATVFMVRSEQFSFLVSPRLWIGPVLTLLASFGFAGFSFFAMIAALGAGSPLGYGAAAPVFAVAWLAGFLVPGAPAGLGVREAILVAFLSGILGPGAAILCAVLHRLLSALLDGALALLGSALLLNEGSAS